MALCGTRPASSKIMRISPSRARAMPVFPGATWGGGGRRGRRCRLDPWLPGLLRDAVRIQGKRRSRREKFKKPRMLQRVSPVLPELPHEHRWPPFTAALGRVFTSRALASGRGAPPQSAASPSTLRLVVVGACPWQLGSQAAKRCHGNDFQRQSRFPTKQGHPIRSQLQPTPPFRR